MAVLAAAPAALGQAMNIELEIESGLSGFPLDGPPSSSFGAAAGQAGAWNSVNQFQAYNGASLVDLSGTATGVTISMTGDYSFGGAFYDPTNTGDYAKLMDDHFDIGAGVLTFTFRGLANGNYTLYSYTAGAGGTTSTVVDVTVAIGSNPQTVTGLASDNIFALGVTHCVTNALVTNGTLTVNLSRAPGEFASITGFQLVPAPGTGLMVGLLGVVCARRRRR